MSATRTQIALVYIAEYGFLGVATGIIALGAGSLAAAIVISNALPAGLTLQSITPEPNASGVSCDTGSPGSRRCGWGGGWS